MITFIISIAILIFAFRLAPRPRLMAGARQHQVPPMALTSLSSWLEQEEQQQANIIGSAAAKVQWADPKAPTKTRYCFLYLHGFSASWQETAPVTERLAAAYGANAVQTRLAGHGLSSQGMQASAEDWLQSTNDYFEIAQRLGEEVIIVATSTGAPLALWLTTQFSQKIHSCLFLSPNFRVRSPLGFLLTWPWSKHWISLILGKRVENQAENDAEAACWTQSYDTLALIEMQKTVDWVQSQHLATLQTPVAMVYMRNDPTVFPPAAISVFDRWGARDKQLIRMTLDGDAAEHVFVGQITAPQRIDWTVERLLKFLAPLTSQTEDVV